jgi:uncharacterized protein (DUF433 family)
MCLSAILCYRIFMKLADRIVSDPDTCSGHPRVEGTRIRVSHVLGWLAAGMNEAEILADYPPLTAEDIRACLAFAAESVDSHPVAAE